MQSFKKRLKLVSQRLASSLYLAGDAFTAADISVTYALSLGQRSCGITLGDAEQAYLYQATARDAYQRAIRRSDGRTGR
ncbi:glutathione S-transferase C-terminal domain-containing protein [Sphingosinicellaceae bacterium]|nr:glutathione S-transferase C-terminal domain-containing protein [Sphingosinicellaceae bacterium]